VSKHTEAIDAALEALTQALKRNDSEMTHAASTALDALSRKSAMDKVGA
jgi:hypothetical protein